jgi:hypothetical protein
LPPDGGALSFARVFATVCLSALGLSGCVQQAVLENDVRSAIWKSRTLSTASDLSLAHAALSAQLVELEALYQRDHEDVRVRQLLASGYALMARGFVELRYLEALAGGDNARAEQERLLRGQSEMRARYYAKGLDPKSLELLLDRQLTTAEQACRQHDRAAYEAELNQVLLPKAASSEGQLHLELAKAQARLWLQPGVSARCGFEPVTR